MLRDAGTAGWVELNVRLCSIGSWLIPRLRDVSRAKGFAGFSALVALVRQFQIIGQSG